MPYVLHERRTETKPALAVTTTEGYFSPGVAGVTLPTTLTSDFMNALLLQFNKPITDAGLTIDNNDESNLADAIRLLASNAYIRTFDAIEYPTIHTADNRLTVTPATATNGGTVSVASGTEITMGFDLGSTTGTLKTVSTPAYTSADLDVSSTYYLRGYLSDETTITLYTQKGTDADTIPGSYFGTPDGASGGGFDSTQVDLLIAKIVTGTAGTLPTVTTLANASVLRSHSEFISVGNSGVYTAPDTAYDITLNWARKPTTHMANVCGATVNNTAVYTSGGTVHIQTFLCSVHSTTRYLLQHKVAFFDSGAGAGDTAGSILAIA